MTDESRTATVLNEPPRPLPPAEPVPAGWEGILEPGERILWQGRPDTRVEWGDVISFQSMFGLVFAGFAVFWITMARNIGSHFDDGISSVFPLFGLPFVAVGLHMVVGRLIFDAVRRRGTWYTLSDRTAFIAVSSRGLRRLERYPLEPDMPLVLDDGNPGTVWFAEKVTHNPGGWSGSGSNQRYRGPSTTREQIGFRRIDGARGVYRLMLDAVAARTGGQG